MSAITSDRRIPVSPLLLAGAALAAEFALFRLVYKAGVGFSCHSHLSAGTCMNASLAVVAGLCMTGALLLFVLLRPAVLQQLLAGQGERARRPALLLNLAGLALLLLPAPILAQLALPVLFVLWIAGAALLLTGLALCLAPVARWRHLLAENGATLAPLLGLAAAMPWVARAIQPIWEIEWIRDATFRAVVWLIEGMGYAVTSDPQTKVIGSDSFAIAVDKACSGVEGFALVTLFVSLYLGLFRHDMRFPRALILYPVGLAASALFNVLRITLLLVIGLEGNPDLAVGGFHSRAGWMMFTLVAIGIILLAQAVPALRRPTGPARMPAPLPAFWRDPAVARILPFAVFMLTALLATTFSQTPGVVYPLRMLVIAAVLLPFWPIYRALDWRLDPLAIAAGAAVGLGWVLIPVTPATTPPYGALAGGALTLWFVIRGLGTVLLIPLIEELFFRDYLERRLRFGPGPGWAVLAAGLSAALFAALHGRWAEALVAGLVFSAVARRRDRIGDAILAHAVANAVVFAAAVASGNLAII